MYPQLYRHPPCIVLLVKQILLSVLYQYFLTTIWTAILICLQYSFWFFTTGSNAEHAFNKAWKFYLETQHTLVAQELDQFLKLKHSKDWFSMEYRPSEEECVELRQIVLHNLLRMQNSFLLWERIAEIYLASPKIST